MSVANLARHNLETMLPVLRSLCTAIRGDASIDPDTAATWNRCIRRDYLDGISFLVARVTLGPRLGDDALGVVESFLCTYAF